MTNTSESNCQSCESCGDCNKNTNDKNKKLPPITSAFFILTERCNLACRYCFVNQNPREMTYKLAMDATQFLIENAKGQKDAPSINFFGGEPLLKWDEIIVPLTRYIREEYQKPFHLGITSNGVLLDDKKFAFMKEYKIPLLFSIDGDKQTQNFNRPFHNGKGSFDSIEKTIDRVLAYDPNSTFRATIDHRTVQHTYHNMRFAYSKGYTSMFFIPNAFVQWSDGQKEILKEQVHLFGKWFIEEMEQGRIINLNPFNEKIRQIVKINQADDAKTHRLFSKQPGQGKCGLGASRHASVGTDGTLYGCQEMTSNMDKNSIFKIGNIYEGTNEQARYDLINKFNKKKVVGPNCEQCLLDAICDGGCVANNYMITGDINHMPDILCYWYQILLDEAIYVSRILGESENKLFKETYFESKEAKRR